MLSGVAATRVAAAQDVARAPGSSSHAASPTTVILYGPPTATLDMWSDQLWLRVLDRSGSVGGRFSDAGILRRFNRRIGRVYTLDRRSPRPELLEDVAFTTAARGVRLSTGSVSRPELQLLLAAKFADSLSRTMQFATRVDVEQSPEADRALVQVGLTRGARDRSLSLSATLPPRKGDADLQLTARWSTFSWVAEGTVAALDVANNYNYPSLAATRAAGLDTMARVPGRQPMVWRGRAQRRLIRGWGAEAHGMLLPAQRLDIIDVHTRATVRQQDALASGGLLLSHAQRNRWVPTIVLYATRVHAHTTRRATDGPTISTRREDEFETGLLLSYYVGNGWNTTASIAQVARRERVTGVTDHRDRAWAWRARVLTPAIVGLQLGAQLLGEQRSVRATGVPVAARGALDVQLLRAIPELVYSDGGTTAAFGMRFDKSPRDPWLQWIANPAGFQLRFERTW